MFKKYITGFLVIALLGIVVVLSGNSVISPSIEDSSVEKIIVSRVYEAGVKDLVLAQDNGDFYYINRGLETGMTLHEMSVQVLDKEVTLHLASIMIGKSRHITQLEVDSEVIYTEFD